MAGTSRAEGELFGADSGERIGAENSGGSTISRISERHAGADSGADAGVDSGAGDDTGEDSGARMRAVNYYKAVFFSSSSFFGKG